MSVDYHKHCQKTVLSAYGTDGRGATWGVLSNLSLPNLPANWLNYYKENNPPNITYDFAATLKIINNYLKLSGGTMTGDLILNKDPT